MSLTCAESLNQTLDQTLRDAFREAPIIDIQDLKAQTLEMVVNLNALMHLHCQRIPCEHHGRVECMCHLSFQNACCSLYKAAEDVLAFIHTRDQCASLLLRSDPTDFREDPIDRLASMNDIILHDVDLETGDVECPGCHDRHHGSFLCQTCSIQFGAFL